MIAAPHSGSAHRHSRALRRRAIPVAAVVVAVSLALSACGPAANSTKTSASYELTAQTPAAAGSLDSFTWALYAEPLSLAYPYAFDYPPNTVLSNICDTLIRWNADLSLSPGIATSWANPTPTTWVYQIRSGVTFHDGTSLTAADVVASLNRHLDPAVGSYWYSVYSKVTAIEQTGPMEVTVTSSTPDSQFNLYMAAAPGTIESAATLAADGLDYGNPTKGVNCSGPFAFDSWQPGQSITLKRFDGYWDKALVAKSAEVKFVFLQDPNTRINAFTSGEVDGGWQVPSNAIAGLQKSGSGTVYFGINTTTTSEIVNNLAGPLGDVTVRKALLMAIDRKGLVAAAENGYAEVADGLAPRSVWAQTPAATTDSAFASLESYPYDVAAAKKMVTDAGLEGKEIVIATAPINAGSDVLTQGVAAAATAIGLKPTIRTVSVDQYTALFSDPAAREGIDLFFTNWYLSTTDPLEMYNVLRSDQFSNYGAWNNPEFDTAVNESIAEPDPAKRGPLSAKAQAIANDQLPWLPLYTTPTTVWLGSRITGVAPSINFFYFPWAASIGAAK